MIVKKIRKDKISLLAPAKINLFLEVLNKREDGFHNINSLFQVISLYDELEISILEKPIIDLTIKNSYEKLPIEENIITKAFNLIRSKFNLKNGIKVILTKRIPISAGLGGGSADAATTILACNILFELRLNYTEMANLSALIGSDLPFFFSSGQALVTGRGEILKDMKLPLDYELVLVKPSFSIATSEAYGWLKRDLTNSKVPFSLRHCCSSEDLIESIKFSGNDFEEKCFEVFPDLERLKEKLYNKGAKLVQMSGSGPTMFGIFDKTSLEMHPDILEKGDWQVFNAKPITLAKLTYNRMGGTRGDH